MLKVKADRIPMFEVLVALVVLVLSVPEAAKGQSPTDHRKLVWTTQFAQLVNEPSGWSAVEHHETIEQAFSADDKRLAVTITHHQREFGTVLFNAHLLIIDVHSPETNVRQFDLSGNCGVDVTWNERGDALLVCGTLLRLGDGTTCMADPWSQYRVAKAFWLDSEHVVRWNGEILDLACKQVGNWQLQPAWRIDAIANSKGWVLLSHSEGTRPNVTCEYSIADRASQRALSGWPTRKSPCGMNVVLAVGAEALCYQLGGVNIANAKLHCWAVNGGKEIFVPKRLRDYVFNQAAVSSSLVVVDRWKYPRFTDLMPPLPQQRGIFDFRSGTWISSWKPRIQQSTSPYVADRPYHCALSARSEFLAESGDGTLELYRIVH
jgi:hypothetical protein